MDGEEDQISVITNEDVIFINFRMIKINKKHYMMLWNSFKIQITRLYLKNPLFKEKMKFYTY